AARQLYGAIKLLPLEYGCLSRRRLAFREAEPAEITQGSRTHVLAANELKDVTLLHGPDRANVGGESHRGAALGLITQRNRGGGGRFPTGQELFHGFPLLGPQGGEKHSFAFQFGTKKSAGGLVGVTDGSALFDHEGWPGRALELKRQVRLHRFEPSSLPTR